MSIPQREKHIRNPKSKAQLLR
ncbi:uncharacterized protein G2W53_025051 [Senna tora]|uniref:Uncharacterized protein n=1 Tax=Senna tora TaxID=362788 RepID=A0A834TE98_9FABA|nr:uncharacterized protein G2W53_025051 [Senna tora]